ncbi:MAG: trans-sulfuration enzyme family protein [Planctomycetota bacterium]|jgi:methionine-gamma-lyase
MNDDNQGYNTKAVHAGYHPDPVYGSISPPIFQTSTFAFESVAQGAARFAGKEKGYIYSRMGNPTTKGLEDAVAALEGGYAGLATSSGMAGIVNIFFTYLNQGSHLIGTSAVYGPSRVVVERDFSRFGVEYDFVDTSDIEQIRAKIKPNTTMLYIETPSNPTMHITDIEACAKLAKEHDLLLVVDNTFATPILQRPLELGAHIVVHSMTKFINGHADVVAGMIVASTEEQYKRLRSVLNHHGGCIDPSQAWLVHRGLKTLGLRVERAMNNARALARMLLDHPAVEWVNYPGLDSHPQRALVKKQMPAGGGALMAFGVHGGIEGGRTVLENVKLATLAVSLGGVETLIQHPASMTHAGMSPEAREEAGITDGLVRLSVGIENIEDLKADLASALNAIEFVVN